MEEFSDVMNDAVDMEVSQELSSNGSEPLENLNITPSNIYRQESSQNHLLTVLNRRNTDIKSLVELWWDKYNNSFEEGIKEFIELLFHCSGYDSFVYERTGLNETSVLQFITNKDSINLNPSSLSWIFLDRFGSFLYSLLEMNDGQLLFTEAFLTPLITSISFLIKGFWTSYRLIAAITGVKIMTRLQSISDELLLKLKEIVGSSEIIGQLTDKRNFIIKIWIQAFTKVYSLSMRDVIPEVRNVALKEMVAWASMFPSLLLGSRWRKYIYLGLRDTNSANKDMAFRVISLLFDKEIEVNKQKELLEYLKVELFYALTSKKLLPALTSISVFADMFRFTEIQLKEEERAILYMCVYHESQMVAVKAAQFMMIQIRDLTDSSYSLIEHLIIFSEEADKISSMTLLTDAVYYYIKSKLEWDCWFNYIQICDDKRVGTAVNLFFAYLLKSVNGFSPPCRTKTKQLLLKKKDLEAEKVKFTKSLQKFWIKLIELDRITKRTDSYLRMIKCVGFAGVNLSCEIAVDMCKILSHIIYNKEEKHIVKESCESLLHLLTLLTPAFKDIASVVINKLVQDITHEFTEYLSLPLCTTQPDQIHNKIILLSKHFHFDDQSLWFLCNVNLMHAEENRFSDELIVTLIQVLNLRFFYWYARLMNTSELTGLEVREDQSQDESESLTADQNERIAERFGQLIGLIKPFLNSNYSHCVNFNAFQVIALCIEYLGPHVAHHPKVGHLAWDVDPSVVSKMLEIAVRAFQKDCLNISPGTSKEERCCTVVKSYCSLLEKGYIDWVKSAPLMLHTEQHQGHSHYLTNALKQFMTAQPRNYQSPSKAIYNAVATVVKLELQKNKSEVDAVHTAKITLEAILTLIAKNIGATYPIVLQLHILVISQAFNAYGVKSLLTLLYVLGSYLRTEDIPFVLGLLKKHETLLPQEIASISAFIQSRR